MSRVVVNQWICITLGFVWLALSWVTDGPDPAVVISSVFIAAAFVIGALRS